MRRIVEADTVQIEVTNACHLACSNCTRLVGHIRKPFMMDLETFGRAVDSMKDFPKMVGIMGGEPLLHPQFEQICERALATIPRERLGLWSSFPDGREHYRDLICKTFGQVFLNDHSREDIRHCSVLVGAEEAIPDEREMWLVIDQCWLQNAWSPSINPRGAFFCEIAAAMAMLFDEPDDRAWPVEDKWWMRVPFQYADQMEKWCRRCGCALPFGRRVSTEGKDDMSPLNVERLADKSRRVAAGDFVVCDMVPVAELEPMFQYKEDWFRDRVAAKYGLFLTVTDKQFLEPHLMHRWDRGRESLFNSFRAKYGT